MEKIAIIGAGLLGCFTARTLSSYDVSITVYEKENDVCKGISKTNTGIIYSGFEMAPKSLKAKLCVKDCLRFEDICKDLGVEFKRCGSLMTAEDKESEESISEKYRQGIENGVKGLRLISGDEARAMEPGLSGNVRSALYSPASGIVNPWEYCIAAYENARDNGAEFVFNKEVSPKELDVSCIINCAGTESAKYDKNGYEIQKSYADYLVTDKNQKNAPKHIIQREISGKGRKGINLVPTLEGNTILGPLNRDFGNAACTNRENLNAVLKQEEEIMPYFKPDIIRSFSGVRPNPKRKEENIKDFVITCSDRMISFIGVKTPGLTCAYALSEYTKACVSKFFPLKKKASFNPVRKPPVRTVRLSEDDWISLSKNNPNYSDIVCHCCGVTKGEIGDAIKRGAKDLDGIKHRTCAMMGACQMSRCRMKIEDLIIRNLQEH